MKKKSVVKIIATIFVLLTGLILFSPKSVSASAITIKAAFDKKYYNVNSTKKAYGNWVGNVIFFTRHLKVNTGKPTFFTPSIYVVNKKATGLSAKEDGIYINNIDHKRFVHGRVYLMRFRFDLSHLKPGKNIVLKMTCTSIAHIMLNIGGLLRRLHAKAIFPIVPTFLK